MKAIGYAGAQLFALKYKQYSVVICAPDRRTAIEAFELFLRDRDVPISSIWRPDKVDQAKTLGNRPLFWAHVDVSGDLVLTERLKAAGWRVADDGDPYQPDV